MTSHSDYAAELEATSDLLEKTGFAPGGTVLPDVILNPALSTARQKSDKQDKYSTVFSKLNASAIFELSGSPCIYFKTFSSKVPDNLELVELHRTAWNLGRAPMLWVITPQEIKLFDCFSVPSAEQNPDKHLIHTLSNLARGLQELNQIAGRDAIKSGSFWKTQYGTKIDRRNRVDLVLLGSLNAAAEKLSSKNISKEFAHYALIRYIFIVYLWERKILTKELISRLFGKLDVKEVLSNRKQAVELFDLIKEIFNGDLFEKKNNYRKLQNVHIDLLSRFLSGEDMRTGQRSFWPYKFDIIPVELISSIYESFLHSNNKLAAKKTSIHYTPLNLVDLVLDEVFEKLKDNSKILDLACGSGVFLVESLRRLAYRKKNATGGLTREAVLETLYDQVYGVDINSEAIRIAAFSLYLTALELSPTPKSLANLKFKELIEHNLFVSDAFDEKAKFNENPMFSLNKFDAIIGNPPWTSPGRGNTGYVRYCKARDYPISRENLAQSFLWRSKDFAKKDAIIGLVMPTRPFLSHTANSINAKMKLFKELKPFLFINLSALREEKLFPGARAPALITLFQNCRSDNDSKLLYVTLERSKRFRRLGIFEIGPESIKNLPLQQVVADEDILKISAFGSPRDVSLISRIKRNQRLEELINDNQWPAGNGFKIGSRSANASFLKGFNLLKRDQMRPYYFNSGSLNKMTMFKLEGPRKPSIYNPPIIVINTSLYKDRIHSALIDSKVCYGESFYGIAIPQSNPNMASYLNGIINSSLTTYFIFMTSSNLGVERDSIKPVEIKRLPVPNINTSSECAVQAVINYETKIRDSLRRANDYNPNLQEALDNAVFDLYGLEKQDRILVEDLIKITLPYYLRPSKSSTASRLNQEDLEIYGNQLMAALKPYFEIPSSQRKIVCDIIISGNSPQQIICLSVIERSDNREEIKLVTNEDIDALQKDLSVSLEKTGIKELYARNTIRVYLNNALYIIKPKENRYWSRSAALNDVDGILSDHFATI